MQASGWRHLGFAIGISSYFHTGAMSRIQSFLFLESGVKSSLKVNL